MKLRVLIIALLGLALAIYLVMYAGLGAVLSAVGAVGWSGFGLLCLYALGLFVILGSAWYVLLPEPSPPGLRVFIWARMVRDAASDVLPFSQIGGIVLGARAAILHGVSNSLVYASTIVDVTTEMLAQIAYIALGALILDLRAPPTSFAHSLIRGLFIGLVCAVAAAGVFLALQRHGHGLIDKLTARVLPNALGRTATVSAALNSIYRSRARVGVSLVIHFVGWIASAIGVWIAFRLIGTPVDLTSVLALESVVSATRSAAVFIPHALGAQEAAYAVLSPLFGVGPEVGLAVSLLKRARDITLGVPILLIWQAVEGHRARSQPTQA
ncbi:MAG: lysylphosphatidylglycerol synthase domain-containing protein [Pseudomonadota bacterium]|nr:lysylphosphatidylglycerol synthase domain-containing protein [Pseudomonadota bacterium]